MAHSCYTSHLVSVALTVSAALFKAFGGLDESRGTRMWAGLVACYETSDVQAH